MKNCKFIGRAVTVQKFGLLLDEFPFVTKKLEDTQVYGELFEVPDAETLKRLDDFEDHPDWYCRETTEVLNLEINEKLFADLYFNEKNDIHKETVRFLRDGRYTEVKPTKLKEEDF
jgi:gamma-glutamylcyclotransferase (GGCT)/AIG2-like uncharacterized protein YtfP